MARPVKTTTTSASGWKMALLALMAGASLMGAASGQDVGGSLDDFWDGVSENANVTAPRADIGQEGGYFTGGSIVVRAPQDRLQPLRMTAPSIRAGWRRYARNAPSRWTSSMRWPRKSIPRTSPAVRPHRTWSMPFGRGTKMPSR